MLRRCLVPIIAALWLAAVAPAAQAQTFPPAKTIEPSANWSGYVAENAYYTHVTALMEAPTPAVLQHIGTAWSWVGIGGLQSHDLIQAGLIEAQSGNVFAESAWYELLPAPPVIVPVDVEPGAWMQVDIRELRFNRWQITIVNGASVFQQEFTYASAHNTAEWVLEAPSIVNGQNVAGFLPLAGVSGANFAKMGATANGADAIPTQLSPTPLAIAAGPMKAVPTAFNADGSSFSVVTLPAQL
ncbi:MAG TPA: hypothetical protein VFS62_04720 [Chloroflexota bacterium]|nr:hypothetical protein [Chloroflexota bacterium]